MSLVVILETIRRHVTHIGFLLFVAGLGVMVFFAAEPDAPAEMWRAMFWVLLIAAGSQLIGPEFSTGTLQLILVRPINRSTYLLSRVAGVTLALSIAVWFLVAVECVNAAMNRGNMKGIAVAGVNTSLRIVIICSLLALLGSFSRSYANVALYFVFNLILNLAPPALRAMQNKSRGFFGFLGRVVQNHPGIVKSIVWLNRNVYPSEPPALSQNWTLLVLSNAAIALLVACLFFRRREVPYGGD